MLAIFGEYHCSVDSKNRLRLPTGLKAKLGEGSLAFVMKRGFDGCLELWLAANWDEHSKQVMAGLDPFDAEDRDFRRTYFSGISELESDSADRILIPKFLADAAGIADSVTIQGAGEKLEIFPAEKYAEKYATPSVDFHEKASRVMKRATARTSKPKFTLKVEEEADENQ